MKKFLFLISILLCSIAYSQDTINVTITRDIKIYDNNISNKQVVATAEAGQTIYLLSYDYIGSAFFVLFGEINGYVGEWNLAEIPNIESIKNSLKDVKISRNGRNIPNPPRSAPKSDLDRYTEMYGRPNDIQRFESGSYKSITYIWYCARGRYRSVDFVYKDGRYVKDSEYSSNCIR